MQNRKAFMKKDLTHRVIVFIVLLFVMTANTDHLYSQTCSCAGAPLLGSQSTGASGAGNLLLGLTYEFNQITNLYTGSEKLTNDSVERNTQSSLLEINYGLTDRLSVSSTISFVRKERKSGINRPASSQLSTTTGVGDGLILIRYVLSQQSLWNRYHLAIGAGAKAPLGTTSLISTNGQQFNADMQPGTGAWDGLIWNQAAISLLPRSTMNISLINSFRLTGKNERFTADDNYRFGNEFVSNLSFNNAITSRIAYSMNLRFRSTSSDQRNEISMPNTGGLWVSIIPDLFVSFSESVSMKFSSQIPIYQNMNGTQPTTTYTFSASLFFNLNRSLNTFTHGI